MVADIRNATSTESAIKIVNDKVEALARRMSGAGGFVAVHRPTSTQTAPSGSPGAETALCWVTATLQQGRRYKATWAADLNCGTANSGSLNTNSASMWMRVKSGAVVDATGTVFMARDVKGLSGSYNFQVNMVGDFVAPASGTFTVVATVQAATGVGVVNQAYSASGHFPILLLEDIGT